MRWLVGFAAFFTPVVIVLTAAAQTPVSRAINVVMAQVASVTLQ